MLDEKPPPAYLLDISFALQIAVSITYASFGSCQFDSDLAPNDKLIDHPFKTLHDSGFWCRKVHFPFFTECDFFEYVTPF